MQDGGNISERGFKVLEVNEKILISGLKLGFGETSNKIWFGNKEKLEVPNQRTDYRKCIKIINYKNKDGISKEVIE